LKEFFMLGNFGNHFSKSPLKSNSAKPSLLQRNVGDAATKKGKYDKKDAPLSVTEVGATCLDVVFGVANGGGSLGYAGLGQSVLQTGQNIDKAKNKARIEVAPNPLFVSHGHSKGDITVESPATLKYLQRRRYKEVGGNSFSAIGISAVAASMGTLPINPLSIVKQANTTFSTGYHLTKLKILSREIDAANDGSVRGVSLSELVNDVIKVKAHKSGFEGTKLVTSSIPVLGEIVTAAVNAGINGSTAVFKTFDKAFHAKTCAKIALEIHWRAYEEQFSAYCRMHKIDPATFFAQDDYLARKRPPRLTGMNLKQANETLKTAERPPRVGGMGLSAARQALDAHSPPANRLPSADMQVQVQKARNSFYFHQDAGPATLLFKELFTRRSALAVLGSYDIGALIMEPGGWVALTDKIASL
jgi:hypothetical protein